MSRRPHAALPYSKAADLEHDAEWLMSTYDLMARYPDLLNGQHAVRKWEYAMALRTLREWEAAQEYDQPGMGAPEPLQICDVGGAGSNFWQALTAITSEDILLIDPNAPTTGKPLGQCALYAGTVEEYAADHPHGRWDVITCISVIEHVDHLRPFFRALHMLLKPGGLLFLTTDYTDTEGPDVFHFHWMRKRIYNADRIRRLLADVRELGFRSYGEADWSYHGHQVYDYSVCSVALVKKEL